MRFREKRVALTCDVSDMFCQVRLEPEDCKYHPYLCRELDVSRSPDVYWICYLAANVYPAKQTML